MLKTTRLIESCKREDGSNESFLYKLDILPNIYNRISCVRCTIPKSYYSVNDAYFIVSENSIETMIQLTNANYTRRDFSNELEQKLKNCNYSYTVNYDKKVYQTDLDRGKYYFSCSGNSGIQPLFITNETVSLIMGLSPGNHQFNNDKLESDRVINVQSDMVLFIKSKNILEKEQTLAYIQSSAYSTYSYINFVNTNPMLLSHIYDGQDLLNIVLCDKNNNTVNLNGQDFILEILLYKEENDINDKLNNIGLAILDIRDVIINIYNILTIYINKLLSS